MEYPGRPVMLKEESLSAAIMHVKIKKNTWEEHSWTRSDTSLDDDTTEEKISLILRKIIIKYFRC